IEIAQRTQALERVERAHGTQARVAAAPYQDQRLDDELELADPAVAELDVARDEVGRAQLALDLILHRAQLAQRVEVKEATIHAMAELAEQPLAHLQRAGQRTRAQQRRALPGLAEVLIEAERAQKGCDQRRVAPARTQPQVDAKAFARQQLGQHLAQPRGRLGLPLGAIEDVDEVDV